MNRFVILSTPRSGTNYFLSKLVTAPELLLAWEPFNRRLTEWFDDTDAFRRLPDLSRQTLNDVRLRDVNPTEFYETAFGPRSEVSLPGVAAIGFKLFPQHNSNLFWRLTTDPEVKVIVLERRNRFESYASYVTVVREWLKQDRGYHGSVNFDIISFELYKAFIDSTFAGVTWNLNKNGVEYIHFYYEDFRQNTISFQEVCAFIGIDYVERKSWLKKEITVRADQAFSNSGDAYDYVSLRYPEFLSLRSADRAPEPGSLGEGIPRRSIEGVEE
jgi:LPS sulfotransferase NodH